MTSDFIRILRRPVDNTGRSKRTVCDWDSILGFLPASGYAMDVVDKFKFYLPWCPFSFSCLSSCVFLAPRLPSKDRQTPFLKTFAYSSSPFSYTSSPHLHMSQIIYAHLLPHLRGSVLTILITNLISTPIVYASYLPPFVSLSFAPFAPPLSILEYSKSDTSPLLLFSSLSDTIQP